METENQGVDLDRMQAAYKAAVAEVDRWEGAHFREEELRNKAKAAKREYEAALRSKYFGFR